jgi:hypothetical protein
LLQKNYTSDAPNGGHNLRARSQRNGADRANEKIGENHDFQPIGDFLCDNDGNNHDFGLNFSCCCCFATIFHLSESMFSTG